MASNLVGILTIGKHLIQRGDFQQLTLQLSRCCLGEFAGSRCLLAVASSIGEDLVQRISCKAEFILHPAKPQQ